MAVSSQRQDGLGKRLFTWGPDERAVRGTAYSDIQQVLGSLFRTPTVFLGQPGPVSRTSSHCTVSAADSAMPMGQGWGWGCSRPD